MNQIQFKEELNSQNYRLTAVFSYSEHNFAFEIFTGNYEILLCFFLKKEVHIFKAPLRGMDYLRYFKKEQYMVIRENMYRFFGHYPHFKMMESAFREAMY